MGEMSSYRTEQREEGRTYANFVCVRSARLTVWQYIIAALRPLDEVLGEAQ